MSSKTTDECQSDFLAEVRTFEGVAYFSLSLTLLSYFVAICCKQHLLNHPKRGWGFFFSLGTVKILLGILLFSAFTPTCPSGCNCGSYHPTYVYPTIVTALGCVWIARGMKFYKLDRDGSSVQDVGIAGAEMSKVSPGIV